MNMQAMMKQAQALQKEMMNMKAELDKTEFIGESSLVKVTVNGKKEVLSVTIDKSAELGAEDLEMLEDSLLVAVNNANKKLAEEEMFNSVRDLLTVKITVPLGDPNLKYLHTNMMITCKLSHIFDLENFDIIANAMNSSFSRYFQYRQDKWYVESITINNDSSKMSADIELNPFPSSYSSFSKNYKGYTDAFQNKGAGGTETKKTETQTKSTNGYCPGGQGATIDNLVKGICGNIADPLERCKAIHEWLRHNVIYAYYECSRYHTPENCYNNRSHINCADTAILTCSMMLSAGLTAYIVHRTYNGGHFWCIIEINGKKYASDQTGRESAGMSGSPFNSVWSTRGRVNTNSFEYSHRESGFNTC